jgi:hypothetical protein
MFDLDELHRWDEALKRLKASKVQQKQPVATREMEAA